MTHLWIFNFMDYNSTLTLYYCSNCFTIRYYFKLTLWYPFVIYPFTKTFLLPGTQRCFTLILHLFWLRLGFIGLNMQTKFLVVVFNWRMVFRKEDFSTSCTYCYWVIINTSSCHWTEVENTGMYAKPCIHTYLNICILYLI